MLNKNINRFEKLAGSSGQIGNFILNGNDLLVAAADNGLQKIKGGKIVPVITSVNYNFNMNGFQRSKKDTTLFYCSLRSGTAIVKYNPLNGTYSILSFSPNISISNLVNIETEEGNLWIPGENPGEVRLLKLYENGVSHSLETAPIVVYNSSHGLPGKPIFMVVYDGKSYYYSEKDSIFIFDKNQDRFIQDKNAIWSKSFVNNATGTAIHEPDRLGRIWANSGSGVYVKLPTADGSVKIIDAPFRELRKNYPVWSITPTIDKNGKEVVWFSGNEGIIRYDGNLTESKVDSIHTIIRSITLNEDSVFYSGLDLTPDEPDFSHKWNTVRFQFAAPFFKQENETLFSTYLDGWDKGWSEWSKQNFREYGNLSGGTYTLRVKSKNIYDVESAEVTYTFSVSPPWYGSWWAYILYAIAAIAIVYAIVRWRTHQLHEKHRELEKIVAERTYQLSHRVEELAVINSVQEGLVSEMNMQGIYELVGEKIREIFDAQVIDIVTYDSKTNLLEDRYAFEKGDRTLVGSWEPKGFRKHVIDTGQLLLINKDLDNKSIEFGSNVIHGEQPKSALFVPMISGGNVTGMISLQNLDKENAFSDSSVSLLTTLANSMSVALESARRFDETTRLLKETEQRTAELAVINSVQDGLARELDMHGIYKLVGDRLCTLFPDSQTLVIRTFNHLSNQEYFEYFIEKGEHMKVDPRPFMWANIQLIQTKQALLINEDYVETAKKYGGTGVTKGQPPRSAVFVPMIVGEVVKGSISLQNVDKEFGYSDSDLRLLTTLTNSMSVALENARLFDETNRLLKETEQRNAELAVINSVQDGLVREMDMQGIYELVGEKIREIFDAQVIDIVTYDKKANLIEDRYAYEKGDRSLLGPRPPKGFRRHVIETKTLLLHNENVEQAMKDYNNEILIGEVPKSQVYVPMIAGSEVNGIISLQNIDHEQAFSESDVRLLNTLANSMSIALESARLFDETKRLLKETEQRNAELAVINSVQDGLVREMDMEGIYELVGEKIREIFDAQVIDIVMYDRKTKMIEDRYSYEKGDRTLLGPRKPFGFRKHVIENKVEMMINRDLEKLSVEYNSPVIQGETPKSMIMVPMIAGSNVTGIISLQNIDHEDAFSESDARLINTLANTMSIALESARLFDETKRLLKETKQRNAELAVINSVQDGLVREMDMQGIYELVGEKIREIFDAQVIDIVTYDSRTNLIEDRYSYEKGDRSLLGPRAPKGFRKHVIDTGQLLLHNDNVERAMREFDNEIMIGEMPKSQVYVPMITGGEVNGIISLQNIDHEHAFSESDIRLINTLANTMSIALGSARLFDETKRLLKETEQRTAELSVINSVQEGLVREMDIQGIYNLVGEKMRAIFNAQVFDIVTYDKATGLIEDRYTYEKGDRTLLGPRPLKGFRKHVIEKAAPLVINNNLGEQRLIYDQKVITGEGAKSLVMVPMIAGGEATGVISLQNLDQENAFPDSDVRLLGTLASSMSVALENARLFDETTRLLKETEQRTAELAVINSVQDGLAKELDIQGIYDLVGERIRALFDAQVVAIATFDHENQTEKFQYMVEKGERFYAEPRPLGKLRLHLIKTRQKIIINKLEEGYAWFGSEVIPGTEPIKSAVFVPLIIGDKITSYVTLQNIDRENAFSESDIRLLETLANSMSVALENARLFDETTRLLKETEQRTAELAVINSVQDGLATELDIQGIYNLVGDRIRDLFDAQVVAIATFNHEDATEKFQYIVEKGERFYPEARPFDKLRTHLIATRQKILINSDFIEAYNKFGMKAVSGTALPKSALFVPLSIGDKITSYVTLQNIDKENAFSDSDVRLLETLANSMSVALENARLFDETNRLLKETEQRTAELAVINSVQGGLAKELDMQTIYELVGNKIQEVFNAQAVLICTFDHENKTEHFNYHIEKGEISYPAPRPYDKLRQHLIDHRERIYISDHNETTAAQYNMKVVPGTQLPKSLLFVPLISGDKVKSYVSLQNIDTANAFSESDVRLLETLANSMSVALENARLFDETNRLLKETEQRTAELAVINSVQEGLVREMDMQGIYNLVGDRVQTLFNAQVVLISTFDSDYKMEHFNYFFENNEKVKAEPRPINKFRQLLIDKKHTIHIATEEEAIKDYGLSPIGDTKMTKSLLYVPLLTGSIIRGYVSLQNIDIEHAFSDSDIRLLETLANSMSVALENARLFDETNRLLKETEQRTAELAVINSVQDGLAKELDIQGIYDLVGDRLCSLFPDTQTLVIRTFDHETGLEHFQYAIEKGERLIIEPRQFMWANQQLIRMKKPIDIEENYLRTAQKFGGTGVTKGKPPKSAVFVPMMVGDLVKGSISLQNVDRENAFNESDLRLLTTITNSMSVALENARLFDETHRLLKETEQRTAELAVINSVQDGLVREMNMQAIYDLVGNRICELFDTQTVLIRTFDHRTSQEIWQYVIEKGERLYSNPRPIIWANKRLIETKQSLLINENYLATAQKYGGSGVSKGLPPMSALFVPMIVGDIVKGSVSLQNVEKENAFTDSDLRLLTTLTNSMSVALENARLFDESNRLLNDAKQRASELATVNNITQALASQINLEELIDLVGDEIRQLFKANIVYLALLDKESNIISFPYQYGDTMEPMKLGEGLTSKIILNGEPLLINKDVQELRVQMGVKMIGIPSASYLGVPISVGEEVIGVLSVQSTEQENRFNEDDLRLLQTIATSVGVALRKAKLFEEIHMAKMDAEEAKKTAEKANEAKSAFLSTVSHELRTPLTSVLGFAKIIKKRLDEKIFPITDRSDPKTEKTIKQIEENLSVVVSEGQRLTHLINDVLDLAKIEAGKMEWNNEPVSIPEIAERAIAATTSLFETNNLKLVKDIKTDIPDITGDKDKLIQVMVNLISNAVKFSLKGKVTCAVYQEKEEIIISIADTGIGIAPEDHAAVFEQFKQVGDTLTDKPKGTGLGLPICKEIVEHHGGRIWLDSELGKGSTFYVAIPITKSNSENVSRPIHLEDLVKQLKEQVAHSQLNIIGKASHILVVDDDDSIRSLLHQELGEAGYEIVEASNGKEALECVRKRRPDLIILDIMMPEMNGFDVAAVLKNDPNTMDIPIIVLSIVQDKTRGFRIGVDRYLTKPIDTGLLFNEIGSLLEQGKSKKKVMIVDEDGTTVTTLTDVLKAKGYTVMESNGKELMEKAVANQPDIIIMNSILTDKQDVVKSLRFEKGMENVLFLVYQ
ncbi:MAG TPA: GAF domain-containing protein [Chitinophagaceae bacterium]|nr:GAF domain-containing protein [Chitinophagaceae bacterium]